MWPWPVGARGILAGAIILAAMAMVINRHDERSIAAGTFTVAPELVVDPNTVPSRVLTALPHFGPTLIREWVGARTGRPFSSPEDAQDRVRGLGPATLLQVAPYFRFTPSKQSEARQIASSGSEQPGGKPRLTRRKPARSKSTRQLPVSSNSRLASDLATGATLSVARHER